MGSPDKKQSMKRKVDSSKQKKPKQQSAKRIRSSDNESDELPTLQHQTRTKSGRIVKPHVFFDNSDPNMIKQRTANDDATSSKSNTNTTVTSADNHSSDEAGTSDEAGRSSTITPYDMFAPYTKKNELNLEFDMEENVDSSLNIHIDGQNSVSSSLSNTSNQNPTQPPVQLANKDNSCFIDTLIMCYVSSPPIRASIVNCPDSFTVSNYLAFFHIAMIMKDMEDRRTGSDMNYPIVYKPENLKRIMTAYAAYSRKHPINKD
jgi:hypothetical protein